MSFDWPKAKIDEIAEVKSRKRLPLGMTLVEESTPYPYIKLVDVSNGKIQKTDLKYLSPETRDSIQS